MVAKKNLRSNLSEVYQSLCDKFHTAPAGLHQLKKEAIVRQQILAVTNIDEAPKSFYFEFNRAGTNCTLHVEIKATSEYREITDEKGNVWDEYNVKADINWPCHGSCTPATAVARCNFYTQIAVFAAEIEAEFNSVRIMHMTQTAEEVAEREASQSLHERRQRSMNFVKENLPKQMRLGKSVLVPINDEKIVSLEFQFEHVTNAGFKNAKTYKCSHTAGDLFMYFVRTK
jgi:hypothetical protein